MNQTFSSCANSFLKKVLPASSCQTVVSSRKLMRVEKDVRARFFFEEKGNLN
jgi:hypothetical protein